MRIYCHAIAFWCLSIVFLLLFASCLMKMNRPTYEAIAPRALEIIAAVAFLFWCWRGINLTLRAIEVNTCRATPLYVEAAVRNLDSPDDSLVRRSLQTLADYWNHPLGVLDWWLVIPDERQTQNLSLLYKEWHNALKQPHWQRPPLKMMDQLHANPPSQPEPATPTAKEINPRETPPSAAPAWPDMAEPSLELGPLASLMEEMADSLRDAVVDFEMFPDEPAEKSMPLPPMEKAAFITAARAQMGPVIEQVADALNSTSSIREIESNAGDVRELFQALSRNLLELGTQMRIDAALAGVPIQPMPRKAFCKKIDAIPAPRTQTGWVEKYRRMKVREGKWPSA